MDDKRLWHLNDAQQVQIIGALPRRCGNDGFERKISNRIAFEAVFHCARMGCPCRNLPSEYGDDHTLYRC